MLLLDVILLVIQLLILKEVIWSSVWRSKRKTIECLKVMYCTIAFSCVFTILFITASIIFGMLESVDMPVRVLLSALVVVYSFIAHQAVLIYNKRRVKERITNHASRRSHAPATTH